MSPLPKIVQWHLEKGPPVALLQHPDADQLAAFAELSLRHGEQAVVLEHLSQCSECRHVITLAEPAVAMPALKFGSTHSWRPVFAWSGVAACILVAAFFLLSRGNQRQEMAEAMRRQQPPIALKNPSPSASPLMFAEKAARTDMAAMGHAGASREKKNTKGLQNPAMNFDVARDPSAEGVQPIAAEKEGAANLTSAEPAVAGKISARRQAAPGPKGPAINLRESFAPSVANTAAATSAIDNRYPRWTLKSDGTLLRSLDTGASWQTISIPGNAALLHSIATVGAEVWVGGASGALYHSVDEGGHWMRVNPASSGKILSDDVISIEFTTEQQGKFVTSEQEVWTTANGGRSWSTR